jgi:DNA-binding winged helix-turn-helix (wHTH) protein
MPALHPTLRRDKIEQILSVLAAGHSCSVFGLSNTGKTALLRGLSREAAHQRYAEHAGRPGALIFVDCNRVVELSATGFYEIVVRSLIEFLENADEADGAAARAAAAAAPGLAAQLREQHNRIVSGPAFHASLAFNDAVSESYARLGLNLVLLLDEFDEIYSALEDRTLLNLRALKDHSGRRLAYVTATLRPLSESRHPGDNEFAELFAAHTLPVGLLGPEDAAQVVAAQPGEPLSPEAAGAVLALGGGHPGLLAALAQAARRAEAEARGLNRRLPAAAELEMRLAGDPNARAECLKLWQQLRPDEQAALNALVAAPADPPSGPPVNRLQALGLLRRPEPSHAPRPFSDIFAAFVRRHSALPEAAGVMVDHDSGEVWVDGARISILTELEYRLVRLLDERRDRLTTKDMIVDGVWGGDYLDRVDDARIEKLVSRVRAKIEPDPAHPRYLITQRGRGYKLSSLPVESGGPA